MPLPGMIPLSVLVTGASGFIGRHVVRHLAALGHQVTALDFRPPIKHHPGPVETLHCDIRQDPFPDRTFSAIVHLAALPGVRPSLDRPIHYEETNVLGTIRLLEFCREQSIKRFIFASSSSVYGPDAPLPTPETAPCDPCSPYALTKLHGEDWGRLYAKLHGLHFTALRFFTVWGDGQRPDLALEKFQRRLRDGDPVTIYGDGTQRRDQVHVHDIARAVGLSLQRQDPATVTINLGTGRNHSVMDMVAAAEQFTGKTATVIHAPPNPADVPATLADNSLARRELGWTVSTCFPEPPN